MSIRDRAEQILARVQAAGAEGDLIVDRGQALSLKARDGELEEHKVTSSQVFGLRVIRDSQVGTAYSEAADAESLAMLVDQALTNASYAGTEVHEKILANRVTLATDDALLCPAEELPVEAKISMALQIEAALTGKPRVKNVPYNGVQDSTGERHIFSTAGLQAFSRARMCSAYAYALIEDGDRNAMEGAGQAARRFGELDADRLVEKTYRSALDLLDGKAIASGRYDVIFDEEMQPSLFGVFDVMYSGKSAKDGVNPLRDKLGRQIADPRLSITDQPHNPLGFGYDLFDDEGTPTQPLALIRDGVFCSLIHNSMTASYFDTGTTGHATRGPRSTLGVGLHQLEIATGAADDSELHEGRYLVITDLTGLHSGANALSGNFSFGASGYLCEAGRRMQPVRGITVAGNFYEMLKAIRCIGSTQQWNWQRSALMPAIRFADVAISG
jgi:PmbA protein